MQALYLRLMSLLPEPEEGQGLAEYALILVLIAIVCVLALTFLGTTVSSVISLIGADM
ncbi:MAG TPA: Flp family type IVb pilin [Chloroflexota bacterium]|nr:Flp family type IVb pilin [Chloroflexota bacterium]